MYFAEVLSCTPQCLQSLAGYQIRAYISPDKRDITLDSFWSVVGLTNFVVA